MPNTVELKVQVSDKAKTVADLKDILALAEKLENSRFSIGDNKGGLADYKKQVEDLKKTQDALTTATNNYTKAQVAADKAAQQAAKTTEQQAKAKKAQVAADTETVKQIKEETNARKAELAYQRAIAAEQAKGASKKAAEAKIAGQLTNEYLQLNKALQDQELKYKNLALTVGFENKETQEALKTALATRSVLDKVDQNLGNYQRNVGNYASAYNGLAVSLQQVLREAPSAAVSLNTFFLAISNNLPMVFDEITKANAEIKAAKAALESDIIAAREAAVANATLAGATAEAALAEADLAESTILANAAQNQTPSLFKRITSALFSFQSLLTVGILLLTLFGGALSASAAQLFKGKKAIEDTTGSFDEFVLGAEHITAALEDTNGQVADAFKNIGTLNSYVGLAKEGFIKKTDAVKFYNETMGKVTGTVKTFSELEEKLSNPETVRAYTNAMLYRAAANLALEAAAKKSLEAEESRRKKESEFGAGATGFTAQTSAPGFVPGLNDLNKGIAARAAARKKEQADQVKDAEDEAEKQKAIAEKFNEDAAKIYKQFGGKFIDDEKDKNKKVTDFVFERNKLILEDEIKTNEAIAQNSLVAFPARNAASKRASDLRVQLINFVAAYEKKQEGVTADQIKLIDTQKYIDLRDNATRFTEDLQGILMDRLAMQAAITEDEKKIFDEAQKYFDEQDKIRASEQPDNAGLVKTEVDQQEKILQFRLTLIGINKAKEEKLLNDKRLAGKISEDKYQKDIAAIQRKYALETLEAQRVIAEAELKLLQDKGEGASDQALGYIKAINEISAAISKLKGDLNGGGDSLQKILEKVVNAIQVIGGLLTDAANIGFTKEMNNLQAIEDARQKNYEQEVARINDSTLSEEDKANRLKVLEATRQAQQQEFERKQRDAKIRQARLDKAINIANIIGRTALAVVTALAIPGAGIGQALAAGAIGAAELAIAIATPIPTYAQGLDSATADHYGIYGEAGKEWVKKPGQRGYIADSATYDFIPRGTSITPLTGDYLNAALNREMLAHGATVLGMKAAEKTDYSLATLQELRRIGKKNTSFRATSIIDMGGALKFKSHIDKQVRGRA